MEGAVRCVSESRGLLPFPHASAFLLLSLAFPLSSSFFTFSPSNPHSPQQISSHLHWPKTNCAAPNQSHTSPASASACQVNFVRSWTHLQPVAVLFVAPWDAQEAHLPLPLDLAQEPPPGKIQTSESHLGVPPTLLCSLTPTPDPTRKLSLSAIPTALLPRCAFCVSPILGYVPRFLPTRSSTLTRLVPIQIRLSLLRPTVSSRSARSASGAACVHSRSSLRIEK